MHDTAQDYSEVVEAQIIKAMSAVGPAPASPLTINQIVECSKTLKVEPHSWFPPIG